jgi:flagellar P-ring protein precursor FlgI
VLDKNHADFQVASDVADLINHSPLNFQSSGVLLAKAVNPGNIEVQIPRQYAESPVEFISQILALDVPDPQVGPRVVINERAGSIVISGDVEIGAAVVTHKNIVVETGGPVTAARFVTVDSSQTETPKLKALVETLNAVHVPVEDIIEVIKGLDRDGRLYARLIIE